MMLLAVYDLKYTFTIIDIGVYGHDMTMMLQFLVHQQLVKC